MSYIPNTSYLFNPYAAIENSHISSAANCYNNNQISACLPAFTPNSNIAQMSSNVFHGQDGPNVRSIVHAGQSDRDHMGTMYAVGEGFAPAPSPVPGGSVYTPSPGGRTGAQLAQQVAQLVDQVAQNTQAIQKLSGGGAGGAETTQERYDPLKCPSASWRFPKGCPLADGGYDCQQWAVGDGDAGYLCCMANNNCSYTDRSGHRAPCTDVNYKDSNGKMPCASCGAVGGTAGFLLSQGACCSSNSDAKGC